MGARTWRGCVCMALALACMAHADSFRYDALGRLVQATYSSGKQFSYTYDANGNMTGKSVAAAAWSTVDQDKNNAVSLSELLRVIQFYNTGALHCEAGTEDGFAPGQGDQSCAPHSADYAPLNWVISLSELLRQIQFYNSGGYSYCPGASTEDAFCPGL